MTHPDASDALAKAVLQYLALRDHDPFGAGRLRKRFRELADAALAANSARRKPVDLKQWTPSGAIPLRPRPASANENRLSEGGK